jgi:hypothetical protein
MNMNTNAQGADDEHKHMGVLMMNSHAHQCQRHHHHLLRTTTAVTSLTLCHHHHHHHHSTPTPPTSIPLPSRGADGRQWTQAAQVTKLLLGAAASYLLFVSCFSHTN